MRSPGPPASPCNCPTAPTRSFRNFGNVALAGSKGALALGFWSNKNGQAIFNAGTGSLTINGTTYANITDLQLTDVLNLVQADAKTGLNGVQWDPVSYAAFRSWLLGATAKDMAYMLSAQLVTTELDVFNNYVKAGAYIDVAAVSPSILTAGVTINGTTYALAVDSAGIASVQSIMDAANAVLGAGSTADNTAGGSALRDYENALQTLLNAINNNQVLAVV